MNTNKTALDMCGANNGGCQLGLTGEAVVFAIRRFRFRSITHRLIFACFIAAWVIYSVSYWQMHSVLDKAMSTWVTQLAETQIETVVGDINSQLQMTEQSARVLGVSPAISANTIAQILPVTSSIQGVLLLQANQPQQGQAWQQNAQGQWLNQPVPVAHCHLANQQAYWAEVYRRGSQTYRSYCWPHPHLAQTMLELQLNLQPIMANAQQSLLVEDRFSHQQIGQPFITIQQQALWPSPLNAANTLQISRTVPTWAATVGIRFPTDELERLHSKYVWLVIASMAKDMLLMCIVIIWASRQTTRQLREFIGTTEAMTQGDLDAKLPVVYERDEVGRLVKSFRHMRDALKKHIQKLQEETATRQRLESELEIAGQIQRSMVPRIEASQLADHRYSLAAVLQPARQVGGDLYDFFPIDSQHLCLVIGDVAGKGMPAALLMARTITLIRAVAQSYCSPLDILTAVNREMCRNNDDCQFVTVFCGVLNLSTGELQYASCGHDAPILVRGRDVQLLTVETGPPLGLDETAELPLQRYQLHANDLLVLYTDGITEATNPQQQLFSEERLLTTLSQHPPTTAVRAIHTIQHFLRRFVAESAQSDDITLLVLQYQPLGISTGEGQIVEWMITLNSELTELTRVRLRLAEQLHEAHVPDDLIENSQLIAEEILVNIIQYGYAGQSGQRIDIHVRLERELLTLTFTDDGIAFNPLTDVPEKAPIDPEEPELGGLGLVLVRELASVLQYRHEHGRNIFSVGQALTPSTGYHAHPNTDNPDTPALANE